MPAMVDAIGRIFPKQSTPTDALMARMGPVMTIEAQTGKAKRRAVRGGRPLLLVHGIEMPRADGRAVESRLFRRRVMAYVAELGGEETLTEFDRGQIAALATIEVRISAIRKTMLQGNDVASDELIRLSSESRRILNALRSKAKAKPTAVMSPLEYAARKAAEKADASAA